MLELVETGFSSKNFKTFLFALNTKLVDKKISITEIADEITMHIQKNWNMNTIQENIMNYDKNILVYLNEYLYAKSKKLPFSFDEKTNIEHIMPASGRNLNSIQSDANIESRDQFNALVNLLGNKVLLEEDINKSISNNWFKTKKQNSIYEKT